MARNEWFTAVEQTLPEYVPLPMDRLFQAGQLIQNRFDTNMQALNDVGTGLSSIEARLPGHREYVNTLANNYRQESQDLLDRFGGNASDPQFQREFNRIKNKYSSDRNLSTIALANEAAKRNSEIAAKLSAEGKMFVNPQVTGLDANGNLVSDVGQIRQVNTLDDWSERLKIAAGTTSEEGNYITNKTSLDTAKKQIQDAIKAGSPEVLDLVQAYETRGMSRDQALNQVAQDAKRLSGEYAESTKTNWQKLTFEESVRARKEANAIARAKLAAASAGSSGGSNTLGGNGLYFVPTAERSSDRSAVIAQTTRVHNLDMPLAGRGNANINTKFSGNLPAGERFVFKEDKLNNTVEKKSGSVYIKDGTFVGVEVPYMINKAVDAKTGKSANSYKNKEGRLVTKDQGFWTFAGGSDGNVTDMNIHTDSTGDYVWLDKKKTVKGYVQPQSMGVYRDNETDAIIYRKLNRDETLKYLGPEAGFYSNDGYSSDELRKANPNVLMQMSQLYKSKNGKEPSAVELTDMWTQYRDNNEYRSRHQSGFEKPKTTTPINEYYGL